MARQIPRGFVWLSAAATVEIEPLYIMRPNFDGIVIVIYPPRSSAEGRRWDWNDE